MHIAIGALGGAIVNTAVTIGTCLVKGEEITGRKILASVIGGAVTGTITAINPLATVGAAATGAVVESLINDVGTKPPTEVVKMRL